jgi:S1-C subfamily serine protease
VGKEIEVKYYRRNQLLTAALAPAPRKNLIRGVHIEAPVNWRGMRLADLSDELREKYNLPDTASGLIVIHVESDAPASKAGLKPGQVIRKIGEDEVSGLRGLRQLLSKLTGPIKILAADSETEITLP